MAKINLPKLIEYFPGCEAIYQTFRMIHEFKDCIKEDHAHVHRKNVLDSRTGEYYSVIDLNQIFYN